jgi:hypothetical protein
MSDLALLGRRRRQAPVPPKKMTSFRPLGGVTALGNALLPDETPDQPQAGAHDCGTSPQTVEGCEVQVVSRYWCTPNLSYSSSL